MDLVYAWIASIASGAEPLVIKASSKTIIKNPWLFNILWVAFAIPLVSVLALLKGAGLPHDWMVLFWLAITHAVFYILYTLAIYQIDVSVMAPLFSLRTVFAVILGVILLHEKLTGVDVLLVSIIVLSSPLAAYDEHLKLKAFFKKPVLLALIGILSLAFVGYFTNRSTATNGYYTTILWLDFLVLILLLPTLKFVDLKKDPLTAKKITPFIFLSLTSFLYTVSATAAYSKNLSLSSVIVSLPLSMIFAILLSRRYGYLLEQHPFKVYIVRLSAAAVMVGAAILLSLI